MRLVSTDLAGITLTLTRSELVLVNNALNEVCNGVDIEEPEFSTRLGGAMHDARLLLAQIGGVLRDTPEAA